MSNNLETNIAACRRMAAAGSRAVPIVSLPHPELDSRTAKAVGGQIETRPFIGRRIRFSEIFITEAKGVQKV